VAARYTESMIPIVDSLLIGGAVGTVWGLHDNKKKAQEQAQGASTAPSGLNASTWYPPEPAQAAQPQGRGTATRATDPSAGAPRGLANFSKMQFGGKIRSGVDNLLNGTNAESVKRK
jgi:hypothetical protein